ncbi:MAG: hypothetical protein L6R39_005870 [Caloplaca ligustica]|nr:MAG: hypothetical protein L6R39_005870 [Caloplaca ligustica]
MLQHFEDWLEPETPVVPAMFHAYQPKIHKEPKGVVLIIAPWNYPIVLLLLPLLGAIAAGNCAILKPSQFVPKVTATLAGLIPKYLDRDCFRVVAGGKEVVEELLQHPLDHIFFTGSTSVGKSIMTKASRHPTPVTLELGGKCPAIVTESANVAQAAKRIAWGKFLNAGQTCVAPDYALVHESVLPGFLHELKQVMESTYAHDSEHPTKYGRIINTQHLNRLSALISSTKGSFLHSSGPLYPTDLSISPTVIRDTPLSDPLLQTEIFGPILPVVSYATLLSLPTMIRKIDPTPLATYIFTSHPQDTTYLSTHIHSGTSCVNDVMGHLGTTSLPVSGRGSSGFGAYRGKASIECFSATKTVVDVPTSEDFEGMLGFRYPGGDEELKYQMWKGMECKRDW